MLKLIQTIATFTLAAFIGFAAIPAAAENSVASGTFTGASDHITTGGVEVIKNDDGSHTIVLADDFSLDGAPDPRVGLGKDGFYDGNTDSGVLGNLTGGQSFVVPAGVDVSAFNEVYIWCEKFSVPLGVAKLN
ncbi:DM13 domain-containing protein [uncultured Tateyamaria sp.]|uniref:DM13 domain-containing protein n=1 Tax=uncultured Tateyamaria sp. TaxID=455651 RepID=UPI00262BF853|nr:DM13 domain-containing protein [uncultured Tateyamaria sp.]